LGESRVGQQQPASRRDAVGLVVEPLGVQLGKVLHRHGAQEAGVNGGHAVGAVRADNRQISHTDLAGTSFFHQADASHARFVARKASPHLVKQSAIDLMNNLKMAGQHNFEPLMRPFFEGLRQKRMVRVRE
jgi:hypothetical protein